MTLADLAFKSQAQISGRVFRPPAGKPEPTTYADFCAVESTGAEGYKVEGTGGGKFGSGPSWDAS